MPHPASAGLGGDVGSIRASWSAITTIAMPVGTASTLFSGAGVPQAGTGKDGDFYFRSDTPATANQRIYVRSAGAWIGVV